MPPIRLSILLGLFLLTWGPASAAEHAHTAPHEHGAPHGGLVESVGRYHLELVYDDLNGSLTLYVLGQRVAQRHAVPAEPLTVRVEPVGEDWFGGPFTLELVPLPDSADPAGRSSRFVGTDAALIDLDRLRVVVRTELAGEPRDTRFAVDAEAFRNVFVCPMRCEGDRSYPAEGRCPVCGMSLRPIRDAHGDHSPKHGGILFMAPDGWHHLEGVLGPGEFRLYLYNDFTRPIPATPFEGRAEIRVTLLDDDGEPGHEGRTVPLRVADGGGYLSGELPGYLAAPLDVELQLQFEGRREPDSFSFRFE